MIWCVLVIFLNFNKCKHLFNEINININIFFIIFSLLPIHFTISLFNGIDLNIEKFLYSFLIIPIFFLSSCIILLLIKNLTDIQISKVLALVAFLLLLFLVTSFFFKSPFYIFNVKAVFIYAEPSHFALIFAPFFIYLVLTSNVVIARFLLILLFIAIVNINNLTLLIVFIFAFLSHLINSVNIFYKLLLLFVFLFLFLISIDIDYLYYTDRLLYSSSNNNMSILVYLTGWERAWNILFVYSPLGIGFQQFGYEQFQGYFLDKLINIGGGGLNKYDGSTLGSKIIGEFGLIGILLIVLYLYYLFKNILNIIINPSKFNHITLFFACVYLSFSIYLFVRGMGFFSELPFLFLTSLIFFTDKDFKRNIE